MHDCQTNNHLFHNFLHSSTPEPVALYLEIMSRLAIIAALTAVVFLLGNLWMCLTTYSYVKLHLFILAPAAFLYFVPPRPLSEAHPAVRRFGYISMLVLAIVAVTYSVAGWDHILFKAGVVSCPSSIGSLHDVPYEECFWCIDYTLLISLWVMSIWRSHPVSHIRGDPCVGFRAASTLVCLAIAYYGHILQGHEKNTFYLGVTLQHTFPILAVLFAATGHLYLQCPRECILGVVPSFYAIAVDTLAIHNGIWQVSGDFISGKYVFGITIEHILIYTLTTAMASLPLVGFLRAAEIYQVLRKRTGSTLKALALVYVWG